MATKRPTDVNELMHQIGRQATGEDEPQEPSAEQISQVMAALGRKGGKVGGKARAESLTPGRRAEIARKAAAKRWGTKKKSK